MNGALGREGSYGSPNDGFPDEVRLFAGRKNKSLPGRALGGGKSCRQRGEQGQRSGGFLENGDSIENRCLMRPERLVAGIWGQPVKGVGREPPS